MGKRTKRLEQMAIVQPNAAGLDIGSREIWACVLPESDAETIRSFSTFTPDLYRLADWLVQHRIEMVAMILLANPCGSSGDSGS